MHESSVAGLRPFGLERFFAKHEFKARHNLAASDCETLSLTELLNLASPKSRSLWENLTLAYTRAEGLPALREAIADDYSRGDAEDVLTVVPVEGIYLALRALVEGGDEVIAPWPAYQSLYEVASASGATVKYWKPELGSGKESAAHFSIETLRHLVGPKTKVIVVNFPHNPTGGHLSADEWQSLFEIAESVGAWVLSDEMYRGLEFNPTLTRLPAAYEMDYPHAISLCGLSKRHGLPGLRTGWLATRDKEIMGRLKQLKDYTTICAAAPAEILALIGLEAQDYLTHRSCETIRVGFDAWEDMATEFTGLLSWSRPSAGPIAFVRLNHAERSGSDLCRELLNAAGVLVLPGEVYDSTYSAYFRIGVGRSDAPKAIAKAKELLSDWI